MCAVSGCAPSRYYIAKILAVRDGGCVIECRVTEKVYWYPWTKLFQNGSVALADADVGSLVTSGSIVFGQLGKNSHFIPGLVADVSPCHHVAFVTVSSTPLSPNPPSRPPFAFCQCTGYRK